MLNAIFLWLYCMRIPEILFLFFILTVVFIAVKEKLRDKTGWYIAVGILFLLWLVAVTWNTVIGRDQIADFSASSLVPFHSYYTVFSGGNPELLRGNFMNVLLFYPAGLLACSLLPRAWKGRRKLLLVTLAFAVLSAGIEFCQYRFALGQAETDDVIHNALGAFLGAAAAIIPFRKKWPGTAE